VEVVVVGARAEVGAVAARAVEAKDEVKLRLEADHSEDALEAAARAAEG
jgi:dihydrodipicolinate reductase